MGKKPRFAPPTPSWVPPQPNGSADYRYYNEGEHVWFYNGTEDEPGVWESGKVVRDPEGRSGTTLFPFVSSTRPLLVLTGLTDLSQIEVDRTGEIVFIGVQFVRCQSPRRRW
ncbi:hypothetical protein ACRE_032030 [Hapsidospora chrysogenum ATCC 11550]|uniref:Uncharacterized protein n=1 Tax=Hapsidospora chrysogenum (strain ATCC 11550 / CBS 779.69 / DSM 880 / IAM 14645 / JCM 23072 / IMI 49137) TaxID=857340 RepID=A0A086T9G8_HAPC1|nr:hypothetical protein ACRE_032030 [Hapsidospora chrysogenum ATCC 11550]